MKFKSIQLDPYDFMFTHGYRRVGALVKIESEEGACGEGDLAPLPERSRETLVEAMDQLKQRQALLTSLEWDENTFLEI